MCGACGCEENLGGYCFCGGSWIVYQPVPIGGGNGVIPGDFRTVRIHWFHTAREYSDLTAADNGDRSAVELEYSSTGLAVELQVGHD